MSFPKSKTVSLEDHNIDIVKLSIGACNNGDWSSFANLHSPGYVQNTPDYNDPVSLPYYLLFCRIAHGRLPNLKYLIEDIFAAGDKVTVRCSWQYRNDSYRFKQYFPDGIANGSSISIVKIKYGKISKEWYAYDTLSIQKLYIFYNLNKRNK